MLLLKQVKQRSCRGGTYGIIDIVEGFLHEGNQFTPPHMSK